MSRTSTPTLPHDRQHADPSTGRSERLLLVAIVLIGVIGLAISYSDRLPNAGDHQATAHDTVVSDGQLRSDHMILHLNQRQADRPQRRKTSRF